MGALADPTISEKFTEAFACAQNGTDIRAMLGRFKVLHRNKKWWEARKVVTDYADQHVENALERLKKSKDGTDEKGQLRLVDEMAKDTQDKYTLRSHIISVFSPAHGGAAITLSNAVFHLARHTEVYQKLRDEIITTKDEVLNYDLLNSYKYLSWVLKESTSSFLFSFPSRFKDLPSTTQAHRLTPIATLNHRACLVSTVLPSGGGPNGRFPLYIPRIATVEVNYRAMMRDPTYWGNDADCFVPERWEKIRPSRKYTPFGGGLRTCPDQRLVFMESAYVLVVLVRRFGRIENRDEKMEWEEEMRMTFQSWNGSKVGLVT